MKTFDQMLRELARQEVIEFAVASDRLPCIKVGNKYEPVDETPRATGAIVEMLAAHGGAELVKTLEKSPAHWTTRIEGVGSVGVQAVMISGRVQARFAVIVRDGARAERASQVDRVEAAPAPKAAAAPISRSADGLEGLLAAARDIDASDVHIISGRPVLMRQAGELTPRGANIHDVAVEKMVMAIVPDRLKAVLADQGSCDFAIDRGPLGRFRVNVSRQRTGLKACLRCIPPEVPTLASLGLPPEIEKATHHHQGLVLVTGPTGHGKTSTLAAIVDIINRESTHHVITVEDPVEYYHPRKKAMISQREVGSHTKSFAAALKGSLREDPDVIVVGELRDTETVRMALAASETGHLVLGTMNTPSCAKTIDRVVDLFPPGDQQQVRMTLAGGLHLIVGQRLVPTSDGNGMAVAAELLPGSVALWSLIRDNKTFQIPSLQQRGRGFGIIRLDESLADLVKAGRTSMAAATAVAEAPDDFEALVAGKAAAPKNPEPAPAKKEGGLLGKAGQIFGKRG
ncbi:MAG TPA: PilT/PilU family type 4a pilus ATPase [Polyangiaceae bacterium]|jgi:twitching motility protein PilT|nr:PilT/PilU family type 4a pilus ATPase [Polyangiaceae bacterium]